MNKINRGYAIINICLKGVIAITKIINTTSKVSTQYLIFCFMPLIINILSLSTYIPLKSNKSPIPSFTRSNPVNIFPS